MKPILFDKTATSFLTNGLGTLVDAISCKVTEERNGIYELQMVYPESGIHFADIELQSIIYAQPFSGANPQPFRIYKISKPLNGKVQIDAQHISYQLSNIPVMPFGASNVQDCLSKFTEYAAETCPFSFQTDKSTVTVYTQTTPASIRERLGGVQGSVLDIYGGEFEWDKYTVKLWNHRGANRNVTLRYGKNITDITQEENIATTYTGICPYWKGGDGTVVVTLPEKVIESEYADNYPYKLTKVVDMTSYFLEQPTVAELRAKATSYLEENAIGIPSVSIDVDFVALWQTEEYKDVAVLQRVYLCDTITVIFEKLGVNTTAKIIKTVYDVLTERYTKLTVGNYTKSLADTIAQIQLDTVENQSNMETRLSSAIQAATEQITGQNGGYIITRYDGDNNPYEILIMDTPDIMTAQKVWRWNNAGLGFSSTGYNGPYGTAITQDGKIVADFITAGTMSANRISGGTLDLGGLDNANGQIFIYNANGDRCGQITNAGIAIYSPDSETQVIINPDIGLVQRDSEGNIYYGLTHVAYPDIAPVADDKAIDNKTCGDIYKLHAYVADKQQVHIAGDLYWNQYKYRYQWEKWTNPFWSSNVTKWDGASTIVVQLPEIFADKHISVSITSEGIDDDKIAGDTSLRQHIVYSTSLPKNKADGTSWTDTSWGRSEPLDYYVGDDVTFTIYTLHTLEEGNMGPTARAYAGSEPSEYVLPDPSDYYVALTEQQLGDYDSENTEIVYTLDAHNATITIDLESISTNGYSINELIKLRVVAIC